MLHQAMMELGATVCKPSNPDCGSCPLAATCRAQQAWSAYLAGGGCPDMEDAPRVTAYPEKVRGTAVAVFVMAWGWEAEIGSRGERERERRGASQ